MHTRMLTAAVAAAALMAGTAMAQSTTQTMPQGSTTGSMGAQGSMSGQGTMGTGSMGAQGSMSGQGTMGTGSMGAQGSMSGSMGSTNAGGAMGAEASGNMNAGGGMGSTMSGNMNAGGAMGSTMASSAPPCTPAVGASTAGGMSGTGPGMNQPTVTASANGLMMCSSGTGTLVVSNAPIPDSPSNRAQHGGPESRSGKMTAPRPGPVSRSRRR